MRNQFQIRLPPLASLLTVGVNDPVASVEPESPVADFVPLTGDEVARLLNSEIVWLVNLSGAAEVNCDGRDASIGIRQHISCADVVACSTICRHRRSTRPSVSVIVRDGRDSDTVLVCEGKDWSVPGYNNIRHRYREGCSR